MTQDEIKKLDKRIRLVQDPFGTGFLSVYTILRQAAELKSEDVINLTYQYFLWKMKSSF